MKASKEYIIPHDEIVSQIEEARKQGFTQDQLALAYARVSTKHQEQESSKENQFLECGEYAKKKGYFLVYIFECTESAKEQGRKVFSALLESAQSYNVKNIIVKDRSRLTRNVVDGGLINRLIVKEEKIIIHYYMTNEIIDHESRSLIQNIITAIDADFSEQLGKKSKHAHAKKKEKGIPIHVPEGLCFHRENDNDGKQYVNTTIIEIDIKYEEVIREIFSLFLNDKYTLEKIADYFNARGYKTKRGDKFYPSTVHRILTNKIYTGKWFWTKEEGYKKLGYPFKGYITEEQYDWIQQQIKLRSKGSKSRKDKPYLLAKLILCSKCDSFASGNRPEGYIYYSHKCKDNQKPYWPEKELIEKIDLAVAEMSYNEKHTGMLKERLKKLLKAKSSTTAKLKEDILNQISVLENRIDKLENEYLDSNDSARTKARIKNKVTKCEDEIIILEDRLKTMTVDLNEYRHDAIHTIDSVRDFSKLYPLANRSEKIRLLREMVQWIKYDGEKLEILWKKPFDILLERDTNIVKFPLTTAVKGNSVILPSWVADGIRTRNDWIHIPGLYR
jgi:DNA invertase Pin-like site-specific DNA recombinase